MIIARGYDRDDVIFIVNGDVRSTRGQYVTGCRGYCGKLMSVAWDGSPDCFDVFTWHDGKFVHMDRDNNEKP